MREIAVHLAVAGGVCNDVFLCCPFFVLDEILDVIESVSEGFPTYFCLTGKKTQLYSFCSTRLLALRVIVSSCLGT